MPIVAPYRELPGTPRSTGALPSSRWLGSALLALAMTVLLVVPVVALALQPFSTVATLVAAVLATMAALTYGRLFFSR